MGQLQPLSSVEALKSTENVLGGRLLTVRFRSLASRWNYRWRLRRGGLFDFEAVVEDLDIKIFLKLLKIILKVLLLLLQLLLFEIFFDIRSHFRQFYFLGSDFLAQLDDMIAIFGGDDVAYFIGFERKG